MMTASHSRVTIHMVASLDGFIARTDGSVDWLETGDVFEDGETLDPEFIQEFLKSIDCYVMGSRTYEAAQDFEAKGHDWAYGETPTFVLTQRALSKVRETVEFHSGEVTELVNDLLRPKYRNIWIAGGGELASEVLRLNLADEIVYSIVPVLIGDGIRFFERIDRDIALHLLGVKAYKSGIVELRHEIRR